MLCKATLHMPVNNLFAICTQKKPTQIYKYINAFYPFFFSENKHTNIYKECHGDSKMHPLLNYQE